VEVERLQCTRVPYSIEASYRYRRKGSAGGKWCVCEYFQECSYLETGEEVAPLKFKKVNLVHLYARWETGYGGISSGRAV